MLVGALDGAGEDIEGNFESIVDAQFGKDVIDNFIELVLGGILVDGSIATPLLSLLLSILHIVGLYNCCFLNGVFIRTVA